MLRVVLQRVPDPNSDPAKVTLSCGQSNVEKGSSAEWSAGN